MDARGTPGPWLEAGREAKLLGAARRGDLASFFELLRAHQRPLWRLCFALARHRGEAELLVQETSRRAWRNLRALQPNQRFLPWLVRALRTVAVARQRRPGEARAAVGAFRPNGEAWSGGASGAHEVGFEQRALAAFAQLSVDEQMLLALRLFERLPYADIAAALDLPLTATLHRIAALRESLEQTLQRTERAA
jgi:RNA polymerase sigma-70 factor (ECF subfamily)